MPKEKSKAHEERMRHQNCQIHEKNMKTYCTISSSPPTFWFLENWPEGVSFSRGHVLPGTCWTILEACVSRGTCWRIWMTLQKVWFPTLSCRGTLQSAFPTLETTGPGTINPMKSSYEMKLTLKSLIISYYIISYHINFMICIFCFLLMFFLCNPVAWATLGAVGLCKCFPLPHLKHCSPQPTVVYLRLPRHPSTVPPRVSCLAQKVLGKSGFELNSLNLSQPTLSTL